MKQNTTIKELTKYCQRCATDKPLACFSKKGNWCRTCASTYKNTYQHGYVDDTQAGRE